MILKFYRRLKFPFSYCLVAALVMAMFLVLQEYTNHLLNGYNFSFSWFAVTTKTLTVYVVWAVFAPVFQYLADSFRSFRYVGILKLIGVSLALSLVHRAVSLLLVTTIFFLKDGLWLSLFDQQMGVQLIAGFFGSMLQFWVIATIFYGIGYYRDYLEKQEELTNAELNALKMQLHPHFLFNTLHAIASLMEEDVKGAQKMITQLGDLLRSILEKDQKHTISFTEELSYIKNYLEIERIRFQDRLKVDYQIDDRAMNAEVPTLILQPLVENAIKHGISKKQEGGHIRIDARVMNGTVEHQYLQLSVENDGSAIKTVDRRRRRGVGLRNIRERLIQLYNDDFSFETMELPGNSGYKAMMSIPFKT